MFILASLNIIFVVCNVMIVYEFSFSELKHVRSIFDVKSCIGNVFN